MFVAIKDHVNNIIIIIQQFHRSTPQRQKLLLYYIYYIPMEYTLRDNSMSTPQKQKYTNPSNSMEYTFATEKRRYVATGRIPSLFCAFAMVVACFICLLHRIVHISEVVDISESRRFCVLITLCVYYFASNYGYHQAGTPSISNNLLLFQGTCC